MENGIQYEISTDYGNS